MAPVYNHPPKSYTDAMGRKAEACKTVLKVRKTKPEASVPQYATKGSVGLDLRALEEYNIPAGTQRVIWVGLAVEIPYGYVGMVCSRSGLAAKDGLFILNSPGIIDPDYRGDNDEIGVILYNTGSPHLNYHVNDGDKVAQLVLVPAPQFEILEVETLGNEDRSGFGSTGKA
jgi:dUTP pyrophosphatase